jgi:hypothetical protein
MSEKPLNCWEVKQCGREPGGKGEAELGQCPAATEASLDGIHRGDNAGRACWVVAGTYCDGEVQGSFSFTHKNCAKCDFCKQVMVEENSTFDEAQDLLTAMRIVARKGGLEGT